MSLVDRRLERLTPLKRAIVAGHPEGRALQAELDRICAEHRAILLELHVLASERKWKLDTAVFGTTQRAAGP